MKEKQKVVSFFPLCKKAFVSTVLIHPNELFVRVADGVLIKKTAQQSADFISQKLSSIEKLIATEKEKLNMLEQKMKHDYLQSFGVDANGFYNIVEYENESCATDHSESLRPALTSSSSSSSSSKDDNVDKEAYQSFFKRMDELIKAEEEEERMEREVDREKISTSKKSIPSPSPKHKVLFQSSKISTQSLERSDVSNKTDKKSSALHQSNTVFSGMVVEHEDEEDEIEEDEKEM
jgi:hypothetical protein